MKKQSLPLLGFILILAAVLRLGWLGNVPHSLYWEEVALGYDAYSLWHTGKDHHGNIYPLVAFESFGDYKPSGYFYVLSLFVGMFGLHEWVVRLPSALFGIATIALVYGISFRITKSRKASLWASLALAIMPWHIHLSRVAFETNLATFWVAMGVYGILDPSHKRRSIFGAVLSFVLAMYTYHATRMSAPLIAVVMVLWFERSWMKKAHFWQAVVVGILCLLPLFSSLNSQAVGQRIAETNRFSVSDAVMRVNEARDVDGNTMISRVIHHRNIVWTKEILSGWFDHMKLSFLWIHGDTNPRHQVVGVGLLATWMLFGVLKACTIVNQRGVWLGCMIFILGALPAAFTIGTPHTLRSALSSLGLALLVGIGLQSLNGLWKRKVARALIISVIVFELSWYLSHYLTVYPRLSAAEFQEGYKEMLQVIYPDYLSDKKMTITRAYGRPSMYAMFYWRIDPREIHVLEPTALQDQGEILQINKVAFGDTDFSNYEVVVHHEPLEGYRLREEIFNSQMEPVFYIYEL